MITVTYASKEKMALPKVSTSCYGIGEENTKAERYTHVNDIDKLLTDEPEIEYITGSATLTPSDTYSA